MGVPLRLKDADGNLQEFTSAQENYIAYQIGKQLLRGTNPESNYYPEYSDSALGSVEIGNKIFPGSFSYDSDTWTDIGTYTDTKFDQPVGTHPSTSFNVVTTSTKLYQDLTSTALEDSSEWRRPIEVFDSGGFAGIQEMDDTSLNAAVDRYLSIIFTNDYPGTYKLENNVSGMSNGRVGDYLTVQSIFAPLTDNQNSGVEDAWYLMRRETMTAPTAARPLKLVRQGDSDQGAYQDGIQEMTDEEIKVTFGQRAKTRIVQKGIGKYQLRSSAQGAPTDPGTWVAKSTLTDTRKETADQNFTRESTVDYISTFTRNSTSVFSLAYVTTYTGNFIGDYVSNYLTDYLTDYITVYEPAAYVSNFTRNSTSDYTGDFLGNFIGDYVSNFTRDSTTVFTGDFLGNFIGNYEIAYQRNFTRDSTSDFTGDFLGNYIGNFEGNYVGTFTRNSTRDSVVSYLFDYVGGFTIAYERVYARNFTPVFVSNTDIDFVGNYLRNVYYIRNYDRDIYYARNFVGNYARNFTRTSTTTLNYVREVLPGGEQGYTGGGSDAGFATQIIGGPLIYYEGDGIGVATGDTGSYISVAFYSGAQTYVRQQAFGAAFLGPALYISSSYVGQGITYAGPTTQAYENTLHDQYFSHNDFGYSLGLAYVGAATAGGSSATYTRGGSFIGNYARNFVGDYLNVYLRAVPFTIGYLQEVFAGNYIRGFEGNYLGGDFEGNFLAGYVQEYSRDFTVPYNISFIGDFIGNYDRNFTRDSTRDSTRNSTSVFTGNFVGDYAIDYLSNFTRDSTRNSTSAYTGNFEGNYDINFTRDSTRNSTSVYTGDFQGNYQSDYVGTYDKRYNVQYEAAYESNFTRDSTTGFDRDYVTDYTGDFTGDYQRNFTGNFIGDFAGETIQSSSETIETYTLYVRIA